MERMRALRAKLSPHDSAARFRELGVDVFLGEGRFTSPQSLVVAGSTLRFARACIATGTRAAVPPIPGLAEANFLANESVFTLTALPPRLAVLGGGPIGCELAQAFARFGSRVWLVEMAGQILAREDRDAAELVQRALVADGVQLVLGAKLAGVRQSEGSKVLVVDVGHARRELEVDEILVGVGRTPNVEGLGLEAAGSGPSLHTFGGMGVPTKPRANSSTEKNHLRHARHGRPVGAVGDSVDLHAAGEAPASSSPRCCRAPRTAPPCTGRWPTAR
jgi:pyruvate/2-oxoglutarate dehydrogenase complex dihydrolipoamide dehydrogenase (E3) component